MVGTSPINRFLLHGRWIWPGSVVGSAGDLAFGLLSQLEDSLRTKRGHSPATSWPWRPWRPWSHRKLCIFIHSNEQCSKSRNLVPWNTGWVRDSSIGWWHNTQYTKDSIITYNHQPRQILNTAQMRIWEHVWKKNPMFNGKTYVSTGPFSIAILVTTGG